MKTQLFPGHALPNFLFALHSHYTGDTSYRVWFHLGNSLTRWKKNLFLKFLFRELQKVLYENPTFFLSKLNQKYFLLYTLITLVILHTAFVLIWATPWPDEKQLFLKCSKIRNSRNSQNSVWKPIFFLGKLYQQLFGFTLSIHWWYSIPSLVWFGQLLDPMKKNFFKILKNSQFAKFAKFRIKNHFFPRQAIPTTFWLYTVITLVILNTEFGLIWATPWPDDKQLFLKCSKIRNSRISQNSVSKTIFFLGKLYQQLFGFTLSIHWWYSIPSLVWFGQLLDPMKKNFFKILKKSQFAKFAKFRIKNHFFPRQAIPTTFWTTP